MYSVLILALASVTLGVTAWGFVEWLRRRSKLLMFNLLALLAVALELLLAGVGGWMGAGNPLRDLYAFPILISTVAVPLTLFTFATISRDSGFAWARFWGHGAVCLLASGLLAYNLRNIFTMKLIYPACWQDVVWYLRFVPGGLACAGGPPGNSTPMEFPLVLATVLAAYLALGAGLWWRRHRPWLVAAMGAGILLMLAPAGWGPVPHFLGEALCFCGMVTAAIRYLARPEPSRAPTA